LPTEKEEKVSIEEGVDVSSSKMFMWMPPPNSPGLTHNDEGEKGDKLRRRARARRLQNAFVCMGILCITFVATVTQFKHKRLSSKHEGDGRHEETALGVRFRQRRQRGTAAGQQQDVPLHEDVPHKNPHGHGRVVEAAGPDKSKQQDDFFDPEAHSQLPENSIYRLSMENLLGETESLARFAGMVTLVVNTACK
jgi:hypothetical protein